VIRLVLLACVGCSSIISDPCADGYVLTDGTCKATLHARATRPDMTPDVPAVMPVNPITCTADLQTDADNCGHCGHVCDSGICSLGHCVGDIPGHIIAIGHDYATSDAAMDRVLGNACGIGAGSTVRIGWYRGTAPNQDGVAAATRGLAQMGRTAVSLAVTGVADASSFEALDAVVIEPQTGDGDSAEADGAAAQGALASFLAAGHAVVVLETIAGVSYRFAAGADLATLAAPVDASGMAVAVVAPADDVAVGVVTPYLAKPASVGYPGASSAVIVDAGGDAVVIHDIY
jgi:hypothetical protein